MFARTLLASLLLSTPVWAADLPARSDVVSATIYTSGAMTRRAATLDVPAGSHRILIPLPSDLEVTDVSVSGAALIGQVGPAETALEVEALDTAAQAAARTALDAAEEDTRQAVANLRAAEAGLESALLRLRWLNTLTGADEGSLSPARDPGAIVEMLSALGGQAALAARERVAAEADVDTAKRALEEAQDAEREARDALDRLFPLEEDAASLVLSVVAEGASTVEVEIEGLVRGVSWAPQYEMHLDTVAEALSLHRLVRITYSGNEIWDQAALTLSTADPRRGTAPFDLRPDPARTTPQIVAPQASARSFGTFDQEELAEDANGIGALRAAAPEPVSYGLSVTYPYSTPVTLTPGAPVTLTLDTLALDHEIEVRAIPRRDATAFLVANARNITAEPILPGTMALYRDGDLIGGRFFPGLAPGAEQDIGFGPLDTIRLTWTRLERGEGDTGIFRSSSTLREDVAFTVENTGASPVDVLALYALPHSEQEEVGVEVRTSPRPTETDWRDRKGVAGWSLTLAPGTEERVEMTFELDWPEGEQLGWQP